MSLDYLQEKLYIQPKKDGAQEEIYLFGS